MWTCLYNPWSRMLVPRCCIYIVGHVASKHEPSGIDDQTWCNWMIHTHRHWDNTYNLQYHLLNQGQLYEQKWHCTQLYTLTQRNNDPALRWFLLLIPVGKIHQNLSSILLHSMENNYYKYNFRKNFAEKSKLFLKLKPNSSATILN